MQTGDVLAFIDVSRCSGAALDALLATLAAERCLVDLAGGAAKSCILTDRCAYLSLISAQTLAKRASTLQSHADKVYLRM